MSQTQEKVARLAPGGANFRQWYTAIKAKIYKEGGRRYLLATNRLEIPDYDLDRDLYCANLIGSLVDDTQLKYVEVTLADELLPNRVFTNHAILGLRNVYAGTLATDRMALRGELAAFAWDEATDYDTNADRFQRLLARLEAANDTTSEADRILDFLHRVPHRFSAEVNAIITALTHQPERYSTLDSVVQQIRVYAKRETHANGRASSAAAQASDAAFQTSERACHYCHIPGHIARECRNKQSDIKKGIVQDARLPRERAARPRNTGGARRRPVDQAHHVADSLFLVNDAPLASTTPQEVALTVQDQRAPSPGLILDSGATSHMTSDLSLLHDVHPVKRAVYMADGHIVHVTQAGTLRVRGPHNTVAFGETLHVSTMTTTLLSVPRILASPSHPAVAFSKQAATISINGRLSLRARQRDNKLFYVEGEIEWPDAQTQDSALLAADQTADLWHARLGHPPAPVLAKLRDAADGVPDGLASGTPCLDCICGKMTEVAHPNAGERGPKPLGSYIHADTWGPAPATSPGGSLYFVAFTEDATNHVKVYPLRSKTAAEVLVHFQSYHAWLVVRTNVPITTLRTDNGTEFCNQQFQKYLATMGIDHERSAPRRQYQNGTAERMNRTLVDRGRTLMLHANVRPAWWAEAMVTAAFLGNRTPNSKTGHLTPHELITGYRPNVANFKVFGCLCYCKNDAKSKLSSKANKCMFLGYSEQHRAYKVYDLVTKTVRVSVDVVFFEDQVLAPRHDEDADVPFFGELFFADILPPTTQPAPASQRLPCRSQRLPCRSQRLPFHRRP